MRSLSDAQGQSAIRVANGAQVDRYRFDLKMVDFPICRTRGNYIGAVQEGEGRLYGSVNVDLTRDRGAQFGEAEHRFHENETGEERSALGAAQIGPDAAHTHRRR